MKNGRVMSTRQQEGHDILSENKTANEDQRKENPGYNIG
jgi:hypothetical protein